MAGRTFGQLGSWLVPAAVGVAFGVGLGRVYTELMLTASGWWGAGNTSIGLMLHGAIEIIHLNTPMGWLHAIPVAAGLYGVQAMVLHRARRSGRSRAIAAAVYGSWTAVAVLAAAWHGSRLGYVRFYEIEAGGWDGFEQHAPGWFAAYGVLLVTWHGYAWWSLLRGWSQVGRRPE